MDGAILLLILSISIASEQILKSWTVTELSFSRSSSND